MASNNNALLGIGALAAFGIGAWWLWRRKEPFILREAEADIELIVSNYQIDTRIEIHNPHEDRSLTYTLEVTAHRANGEEVPNGPVSLTSSVIQGDAVFVNLIIPWPIVLDPGERVTVSWSLLDHSITEIIDTARIVVVAPSLASSRVGG